MFLKTADISKCELLEVQLLIPEGAHRDGVLSAFSTPEVQDTGKANTLHVSGLMADGFVKFTEGSDLPD